MAAEYAMRRRLVAALAPLHAIAVENRCGTGTPDVECLTCWLELKRLTRWPARALTPVRIEHFTIEQRHWLRTRVRVGGNAFFVLAVGFEWLVLAGDVAASIVGRATRAELLAASLQHWPRTPTDEALLAWFSNLSTTSPSASCRTSSLADRGASPRFP